MKKIITILIITLSLFLFSARSQAQLLSWQQKVELVNAPDELNPTLLKELFKANGFVYADYNSAGATLLANSLSKENGKWYAIGNKHTWNRYIQLGRGNISIDMEKNQLIFKNKIPKSVMTKTASNIESTQKTVTANETTNDSPAVTSAKSKLPEYKQIVLLEGIAGDFDQNQLMTLFTNNGIPKSSFGGYPNLWLTLRSVKQIDTNWYVEVHEDLIDALDKYDNSVSIKNGKMLFTNMP